MQNKNNKKLLNPNTAVSSYFDSLLQDDDEALNPAPVLVEPEATPTVVYMPIIESDLAALERLAGDKRPIIEPKTETTPLQVEKTAPAAEARVLDADEAATAAMVRAAAQTEPDVSGSVDVEPPLAAWHDIDFPMQCLMFDVAGYKFSLPLIEMGSVLNWGDTLTKLPGSPPWFLGLLKHRDRNIRVVDTAQLLRLQRKGAESADANPTQNILVFGESNWAITCDHLGEVVRLDPDDVQWKEATQKSLSLGTIRKSLALLLDPDKILAYLNGVKLPGARTGSGD